MQTSEHHFPVYALSRRADLIAAIGASLAGSALTCVPFSDVSELVAQAGTAPLLLIDVDSVHSAHELSKLEGLWHAQSDGSEPLLVLIGETELTQPLRRYALRILTLPLDQPSLTEATEAATRLRASRQTLLTRLAEAEHGLHQREKLLAMLAHEVRNPLAAIRNVIDSLSLGTRATDDVINLLTRQINHLASLPDAVYDFTYVSGHRVDLRREPLDLRELVSHALEMVDASLRSRDQFVQIHRYPQPITVLGDRARLLQVLVNVFDNAGKYSARGQSIEARLYLEQSEAVVTVRDFGEGLDGNDLNRVFEPFVQRSTQREGGRSGLGLGLAIVRRLVTLHDGSVTAHSEGRGLGSCFEIRLPCAG